MPWASGFSLFEVMISLFLLSLFLIGWETMQVIGLGCVETAYHHTVAVYQLNAMAERFVAARGEDLTEQIALWNNQNAAILPRGRGEIQLGDDSYQINLHWGGKIPNCNRIEWGASGCINLKLHR